MRKSHGQNSIEHRESPRAVGNVSDLNVCSRIWWRYKYKLIIYLRPIPIIGTYIYYTYRCIRENSDLCATSNKT